MSTGLVELVEAGLDHDERIAQEEGHNHDTHIGLEDGMLDVVAPPEQGQGGGGQFVV